MDAQAENNPGVGHGINAAQAALELALTGANCLDMIGRWHTRSQKISTIMSGFSSASAGNYLPRDEWQDPSQNA